MHKRFQIKKKLRSPFTKTGDHSHSVSSKETSPIVPLKLLSRCDEVPMDIFMDCVCDNNLSSLVVSGHPKPEELAEAWTKLFYEYCDLVEHAETRYRNKIAIELRILKVKVNLTTGWLKMLSCYYAPQVAHALRTLGFNLSHDENSDDYINDIKRIQAELIALRFSMRVKQAEYDSIKDKKSTDEIVDRKYFFQIFDNINDLRNREVITAKSTVMQFAIALSKYKKAIDDNKKLARGRF